jgi:sec-independent protein translocase protein TatA
MLSYIKVTLEDKMFGIGKVEELVVVLVIILVLVGGKKLPELSRGLSESIREVRKGFRDDPHASAKTARPEASNDQTKA